MLLIFTLLSFDQTFCEPPYPSYKDRDNSDLIQVHLVSRHGARTPLHIPKKISNLWKCVNAEFKSFQLNNSVHISNSYGKSLFLGNCQFGQLIGKGADALQRLGEHIRKIYINQLKFLPTNYNPSVIKFRSTYTLRTLHSQMNFANGLYPNHGPLVINTADKNYDPWRRASAICPNLQERMEELKKPSYLSSIGLYNETLTKIMTDAYGTKWEHINDAATSARCQGFKLPPNITHKLIDAAVHLRTQQMLYVYRHESVYPLFFSFSAAEMLNEMISRVNGESLIKFFHWSAHDGNILAFLGYLGCEITQWPPYGSYIIVELRKSRNNKDYFLQFRYNGKLMKMPRFSGVKSVPFDMFRKFVEMKIPDMKENCGFNELNFAKLDVSLPEAI